jgi:cytochrome c2
VAGYALTRLRPAHFILAAIAVAASLSGAAAEPGDAARGQRVFQYCFSCHSVDPNEKAKLQGPSLYGVIGRKAGTFAGFDYSDAMKAQGASGLVWTAETLDRYIADPEAIVPGTRMSIPPLRDAQDRADLIAYLAQTQ